MKQFFGSFKKILNVAGKIFLVTSILIFTINLFIIFSPNKKEKINFSKINEQNRAEIYKNINDKKINSSKQGKTAIVWYRLINCAFIGEACTNNPNDGEKNFSSSIFGYVTAGITIPYLSPPASGIYWVYNTLYNTNLVPRSLAAEGIGFSAIQPLAGLWKIFRNAAYLILVTILIAIGFMIMFRVKINPQAIISLENSLPRIVVTLLLITFSFPIAGFMIDLMYIIMALGISLFSGYIEVNSNIQILSGNGWSLWDKIFTNGDIWNVGYSLFEIMPAATGNVLRFTIAFITMFIINRFKVVSNAAEGSWADGIAGFFGKILSTLVGSFTGYIWGTVLYFAAPVILSLIVFISALTVFFRIFFMLFKSYIKILLLVIFSPLMLLLDVIPGRKMFLTWLKNMVSNLIAFPIVSTLIILSSVISSLDSEGKLWKPPFLYSTQDKPILLLISIGILFMIPDIVKVVRGGLGIKDGGLNIGSGLYFGGVTGAAKTAMTPVSQLGSFSLGWGHITKKGGILGKIFNKKEG